MSNIEIFITRNKQFAMRHKGDNGKKLSATETETRKANIVKNIKAHMKIYGATSMTVTDLTGKKPKELIINL